MKDPKHGHNSQEDIQETATPYEHEINITEGSEFLDDAIRTKEQPYVETPEEKDII
jgi:hypothetical protein